MFAKEIGIAKHNAISGGVEFNRFNFQCSNVFFFSSFLLLVRCFVFIVFFFFFIFQLLFYSFDYSVMAEKLASITQCPVYNFYIVYIYIYIVFSILFFFHHLRQKLDKATWQMTLTKIAPVCDGFGTRLLIVWFWVWFLCSKITLTHSVSLSLSFYSLPSRLCIIYA